MPVTLFLFMYSPPSYIYRDHRLSWSRPGCRFFCLGQPFSFSYCTKNTAFRTSKNFRILLDFFLLRPPPAIRCPANVCPCQHGSRLPGSSHRNKGRIRIPVFSPSGSSVSLSICFLKNDIPASPPRRWDTFSHIPPPWLLPQRNPAFSHKRRSR